MKKVSVILFCLFLVFAFAMPSFSYAQQKAATALSKKDHVRGKIKASKKLKIKKKHEKIRKMKDGRKNKNKHFI